MIAAGLARCAAALVLGAGAAAAAAAGIQLPAGPGADLVYARCQTCHDLQYVVDAKGLLPEQWRAVLAGMHDYGLEISPADEAKVLTYLTAYLGPNPPPRAAAATPSPAKSAGAPDGRAVFAVNCASCHGADGRGQPGYYPPLAGNPDLLADPVFPAAVVLNGLSGPIEVAGRRYDGAMPPLDYLSDAEIAAVVNFVRTAWGQPAARAGQAELTAPAVAEQRRRALTPAQVHEYRARLK